VTLTETTYHDIEPYVVKFSGKASARCLTHQVVTTEQWHDMAAAGRGFACDEGRGLRFITEAGDGDGAPIPVMRDLSGMARMVRADAEGRAYTGDDAHTRAWLWLGAGRVEPLEITLHNVTPFDLNDYATQTWTVTGEDGRLIVSFPVRIDGRA
jgi:hypothetical protein